MDKVFLNRGFAAGSEGVWSGSKGFFLWQFKPRWRHRSGLKEGRFVVVNEEPKSPDSKFSDRGDESGGKLARSTAWSSLGWQLLLTFVVFAAAGRWIDNRYDSEPWGVLGGCLFGFIALVVRALRESGRS